MSNFITGLTPLMVILLKQASLKLANDTKIQGALHNFIIQVQNYRPATNMLAQTTWCAVLGQRDLEAFPWSAVE